MKRKKPRSIVAWIVRPFNIFPESIRWYIMLPFACHGILLAGGLVLAIGLQILIWFGF